jgi:hypothetical protein
MSGNKRREIGEGDRESARRYNKHTREFVEAERRKGRQFSAGEADDDFDDEEWVSGDDLTPAERKALDSAREENRQVSRSYRRSTISRDR